MPGPNKPRKFRVDGCASLCSLNPRQLPAGAYDSIHRWYEQGLNPEAIASNAKAMGWELTPRSIARHKRNHLVPEDHLTQFGNEPVVLDADAKPGKLSDLEILDKIIQAGSKQLNGQSVRISPEMTMKAMELRLKLTQGSVFDDFMAAVGKAFGAPDVDPSDVPEDPGAFATDDEREQGLDDGPAED